MRTPDRIGKIKSPAGWNKKGHLGYSPSDGRDALPAHLRSGASGSVGSNRYPTLNSAYRRISFVLLGVLRGSIFHLIEGDAVGHIAKNSVELGCTLIDRAEQQGIEFAR